VKIILPRNSEPGMADWVYFGCREFLGQASGPSFLNE
jgi:hypothetical protein